MKWWFLLAGACIGIIVDSVVGLEVVGSLTYIIKSIAWISFALFVSCFYSRARKKYFFGFIGIWTGKILGVIASFIGPIIYQNLVYLSWGVGLGTLTKICAIEVLKQKRMNANFVGAMVTALVFFVIIILLKHG